MHNPLHTDRSFWWLVLALLVSLATLAVGTRLVSADDADTLPAFHGSAAVQTPYGSSFGAFYSEGTVEAYSIAVTLRLYDVGPALAFLGNGYYICTTADVPFQYYRLRFRFANINTSVILQPASPEVAEAVEGYQPWSYMAYVRFIPIDVPTETFLILIDIPAPAVPCGGN